MSKEKKTYLDKYTVDKYTTSDYEEVFAESKLNKDGFPSFWPSVDRLGKRAAISFVNVTIYGEDGVTPVKEGITFDFYDGETYNPEDPAEVAKAEALAAYLSKKAVVKGGIYINGAYSTNAKKAELERLTKRLIFKYFAVEDGEVVKKLFDNDETSGHLPYYPRVSRETGKELIFSAVDASIVDAKDETKVADEHINFYIYKGDILDLKKKADMQKAEVIKALLDENRTVKGFYYKGEALPRKLSTKYKLYLEKSFVKKNFTVEQRDYLLTSISKDSKSGYPLFWPMQNSEGRPIAVSVVNAISAKFDSEKYSNFDVYTDEKFDLTKEEFKTKLAVIEELLFNGKMMSGALYLDGVLIPGIEKASEIDRRKSKVEKALKVYIDNNPDFVEVSNNFTIEDREHLINLGKRYDHYYPDGKTKVSKIDPSIKLPKEKFDRKDPEYKVKVAAFKERQKAALENIPALNIIDCNILDEYGRWVLKENVNLKLMEGDREYTREAFEVLKACCNPTVKVRGAVYHKGLNMARNSVNKKKFIEEYLPTLLTEKDMSELLEYSKVQKHQWTIDKKSKMPIYWPTTNKEGREVLCSVVDANVWFKVGRQTIKACNDMNFDIYTGETFGLVGESGSGKTTISRAILGINKLTKGGIYFKGKLISGKLTKAETKATKKNIQMIFQDPAASLNERANVDYIISEGLYNFHLFKTQEERLEKVSNMLRQVGLLPEHLSRYPHEFSGGQRQRIGIARALVIEPQLVLADEPISALDVSIRAQVLNLLRKLQDEQDLTYLFIAHDLSIIRYISNRIAVMHKGYVVELGPAEEIYTHPLHPYTRSLLTAIPQPDPKTKDQRKKIPYVQGNIVYGQCKWKDYGNEHFVLVNDELDEDITKRVAKIERK